MTPGASSKTSKTFSLRAPIANEDERAIFQARLSRTTFGIFILSFGFWAITTVTTGFSHPGLLRDSFLALSSVFQIGSSLIGLLAWIALRSPRKELTLDVIDVVTTFAMCTGWALMIVPDKTAAGEHRPEMASMLAITYTLIVRCALVPSTTLRTGVLSGISCLPLIVVVFRLYGGTNMQLPLSPMYYLVMWCVLGTAATAMVSHAIYGLRQEVRRAMQLGQYLLEEKIGEGGMGAVYRAKHAMLRRPTAIKLVTESTSHSLERFEREVRITARLTHPNTIAIFDYGRTPDGVFYYAMEYLEGASLERLVDQHGPQPAARVVHLVTQMCGALEEAHGVGLVHRDIKPANVMLTERGGIPDFVKVLDFGLVKERAELDSNVTNENTVLGTPHYMAPESIRDGNTVDARADLYAVGATAYFLLTGKQVFEGANLVEVCAKHLHTAPIPPSERRAGISSELDAIVMTCLAKDPKDRPADAATLAKLLRETGLAWSREDADQWWRDHDVSAPSLPEGGIEVSKTVAIALAGRS